jgi:gliding motility-associated-like protein
MRRIYTTVLLIFCGLIITLQPARASHLLGADIGWKYLGSDTFIVTATVYRDCNGIPMPAQEMIIYTCNTSDTINLEKVGGMNITPVCKNSCSRCGNTSCSFGLGIEEYIFSGKVNLKALDPSCCKFKITWVACCYANVITTTNADATGDLYYVDGMIDICAAPNDNSPEFKNQPVMIFNVNQCQTFNFSAGDPDVDAKGRPDSLVYLLDTALKLGSTKAVPVIYQPGYSYNHPLIVSTNTGDPCRGFNLDTFTGDLKFKALKSDVAIVNVLVQEWGKNFAGMSYLKGYTHRSVTFFTQTYNLNNPPALTGFNGGSSYEESFCVGQKQCLTIQTSDPDSHDTVSIPSFILDNNMHGAFLNIQQNVQHPTATLCWQPDMSQAGKTYHLLVEASDNACPLSGHTAISYTIHVNPAPNATVSVNRNCGDVQFKVNPASGSAISNYVWTGDDGLTGSSQYNNHHYRKAGTYTWRLIYANFQGCMDTASGTIIVPDYLGITVTPEDTLICLQKNSTLIIKIHPSAGKPPYQYFWQAGKTMMTDTSQSINVTITKDTTFMGIIKDAGGCVNYDSSKIKASAGGTHVKLIPPDDTTYCDNQYVTLTANATDGDGSHYYFTWQPAGVKNQKYSFVASHTQSIALRMTDGCSSDSATVHIGVLPALKVQTRQDTSVCNGTSVKLTATGTGGKTAAYIFTWDQNLGAGAVKTVNASNTTTYHVTLTDGCSNPDTGSVKITAIQRAKAGFSVNNDTIKTGHDIQFNNSSGSATSYNWDFGDSSTSTDISPSHHYKDSGTYTVRLIANNAGGCSDTLTRFKYIHVFPGFLVYLPNAFTPDQDIKLLNECFEPKGSEIKEYTLEVFSRWGSMFYTGKTCWDGTYKGEPVPDGMYIYHINVTANDGSVHIFIGPFYVIR